MTEQKAISRSKRKKESQVKSVLRHLAKNKLAMAGGIIMIIMILAAIFAPFLTPYTYEQMDTAHILEGPSAAHLCGTDIFGRDMFTRLLYGCLLYTSVPTPTVPALPMNWPMIARSTME